MSESGHLGNEADPARSGHKFLMAREYGYWQDIDGFYSRPPKILQLPYLAGTQEQVLRQFNLFASLALRSRFRSLTRIGRQLTTFVANRSMIMPSDVTVTMPDGSLITRSSYLVLPMPDLYFAKDLPLLETNFISHAASYLTDQPAVLQALTTTNEVDTRAFGGIEQLADRLKRRDLSEKQVITLINWEAERLGGEIDASLQDVQLCARLDLPPDCVNTCRKA
jgi:hypothetical protein